MQESESRMNTGFLHSRLCENLFHISNKLVIFVKKTNHNKSSKAMIIQPQDRDQYLLYGNLGTLLSEEHPVRLLDMLISMFVKLHPEKYNQTGTSEVGRPAYSTETMLKIVIYGYMNHISSSRRLEIECNRNYELIWLTGNLRPDFWTIADFRKKNKELIKEFSRDVQRLLKESGLIRGKITATDGTKLKANAGAMISKDDLIERLQKLNGRLDYYLEQSEILDSEENLYLNGIEPVKEQQYQEEISQLQQEIQYYKILLEKVESSGRNYISETDTDCNFMKSHDGKYPGYNVQFTVDSKHKFIVDESVTNEANDINQLEVAVESMVKELDLVPEIMTADTGYCNSDQIQKIEETYGITCFVPHPTEQGKNSEITFTYDEENDRYICSEGQTLTLRHKNKKAKNSLVNVYVGNNCRNCKLMSQCTSSKKGRHISRFWNHEWRQKHKNMMSTQVGAMMMKNRKGIVEHVMGNLKIWLGKIPLLTRGIESVTTEIKLFSSAYNLKKLIRILPFNEVKSIIELYMRLNCQRTTINSFFYLIFSKLSSIKFMVNKKIFQNQFSNYNFFNLCKA
jgi:transposase